jgi:DNA-binding transcriptional MerR regulator
MLEPLGMSTGAVALQLGVREITIQNLVRYQLVPAPPMLAGRRIWRAEDVERVRAVLVRRGVLADGGASAQGGDL